MFVCLYLLVHVIIYCVLCIVKFVQKYSCTVCFNGKMAPITFRISLHKGRLWSSVVDSISILVDQTLLGRCAIVISLDRYSSLGLLSSCKLNN